ncbi:ABC transporter ATP-binding protein [Anaeromyxobacter paludicola]|uniref:Macrolide ABC transporter ATP-binding protein n=1 Tax=Anaeromyxobacter paludicola TaxID=2918171 RepID=A0ABN6NAM0_9BACT|nr:ABC transporter ATP-binding protein [Anaeromyxobacter paludicola]BDG10287.1 macrolide ABC transporter ATP-binding protein [Anaeromyxobacter paludicola]
MIQLRGIRKAFQDGAARVTVLDGVDLAVHPGEMTAVVGPSGSGKSTLLYVAGALDADFEGEALVAGESLRGLSEARRARLRNEAIGFVFQSFNLLPAMTALENVLLPAFFGQGGPRPDAPASPREAAREALSRVGLAEKAHRRPGELSGGERQRVAIARALFARPRVLLADEPTGNLDLRTGQEIIEIFVALAQAGLAVLVATHEERVSSACGRVLRLDHGRLQT